MAYHASLYSNYENNCAVLPSGIMSEETRNGGMITSGLIVVGVVITLVTAPVSAPVVAALSFLGAVALLVGCAFYSA